MFEKQLIYVSAKSYDHPSRSVLDPVQSIHEHENCYRIIEQNPDPEHWYPDFKFGDLVRCENHKFAENEFGLIAVEKCNHSL